MVGATPARWHSPFISPYLFSGERCPASGEKDLAGGDFIFSGIFQKLAAKLARQEDGADLALERYLYLPAPGGIHGEVSHLADPDASATDALHQQG